MSLEIIWFVLIAVLFTGYFILEGFDFGVGILLPFLGKDDLKRRVLINTVGPHWDGNEVWLITAGGAMFAAFPGWYATLFSGFYLPLFLMLIALIFRGVAFEFRSKDESHLWRSFWDWAIFFGSLIPALLWGVALVNFIRGVPIDASMNYAGGFWNLLNPYALVGGFVSLLGFTLQGAIFLSLRTTDFIHEGARKIVNALWLPVALLLVIQVIFTYFETDIFTAAGARAVIPLVAAPLAIIAAGYLFKQRRDGWAFALSSLAILLTVAALFLGLYPRVMVSSLDPAWSLTVANTASGATTLKTMSIIALIFVPIVLAYQGWSYWIFRNRIVEKKEALHY